MNNVVERSLFLPDDAATARLGAAFAQLLRAGDTILLSGGIGAGKTHFSFTLVQTYDAGDVEIWHADLYRLSHPDEALELGLDAAFDAAICLVEWPDRLGNLAPPNALHLTLTLEGDGRRATFSGGRAGLSDQLKQANAHG
jgi:tRNA threonylcarbamoyladenosine biosynthesis protein TsaE